MPVVRMPDGVQVRFPDDMPPDQIRSMILQKFPDAGNAAKPAAAAPAPAAPVAAATFDSTGPFKTAPVEQTPSEAPWARAAKLSLQATGRGAAGLAGAPVDLPYALTNLGIAGINKLSGLAGAPTDIPYAEVPFLGGNSVGGSISDAFGQ